MNSEDAGWIVAGVTTIIATLAGAVAKLFHSGESKNAKAIEDLKKQLAEEAASKKELEKFIRGTLLKLIEDNSGILKENHILFSRCIGVLEAIENHEDPSS